MALGKAFIEVHADTAPFARELANELNRILKAVENGPARKTGEKLGKELGEGATESFDRNFLPKERTSGRSGSRLSSLFDPSETSGFAGRLAKGIVDSIDDGLSGLPAEVKVVLGAALLAALPVAGGLGAALAAAAVTSFLTVFSAGIGVALTGRLTIIQSEWARTLEFLSNLSVQWVQPIVGPLLTAFGRIRDRAEEMGPEIARFFDLGARAIVPLVDGILDLVQNALPFLNSALSNIDEFANILANGFGEIGTAAGRFFDQIANNDDATTALNDILLLVVDLINLATGLVTVFLDLYGTIRDAAEVLDIFNLIDFSTHLNEGVRSTDAFSGGLQGLFDSTTSEAEAMEELNKQLDEYIKGVDQAWSADITFEQSLDDLTASLKENGRTTDINTQKGRDNQTQLRESSIALVEQRAAMIALNGDTETANAIFEVNRQRLLAAAIQGGITKERFDELTAAILNVPPPVVTGVTATSLENLRLAGIYAFNAAGAIAALIAASRGLSSISIPAPYYSQGQGGMQQYADGGIFNRPTAGIFGEAGEEVLIPTTKPARAAELISQSPMLSSMMSPNVNVYIGNRQLDAYIDQRVARSQATTARGLTYGSRSL